MALFYNYTNEDFQITWDKHPYTFKSGQVYERLAIANDGIKNVELTDTVCRVLAHHLAHKVLNAPSLDVNFITDKNGNEVDNEKAQRKVHNINNVELLIQRGLNLPDVDLDLPKTITSLPLMADDSKPVEAKEAVEKPKAKIGRPKKVENSPSENAEFAI